MRSIAALALVTSLSVATTTLTACNDVPVGSLDLGPVVITLPATAEGTTKVDILWVIDNSSSMCEEQVQLAGNVQQFLDNIGSSVAQLDYRLAVVTTNTVAPDVGGVFQTKTTTTFPAACQRTTKRLCSETGTLDAAVATLCDDGAPCGCDDLPGDWRCEVTGPESNLLHCNGVGGLPAYGSRCVQNCADAADCSAGYACQAGFCVLTPDTAGCGGNEAIVAALGPAGFVTPATVGFFPCIATVGIDQSNAANAEQGLNAAMAALAPDGPNAAQAQGFLREDAHLLVVFISDEDDCSVSSCGYGDDGAWSCPLGGSNALDCRCLTDTNSGGPLKPVNEFVNGLRALKEDPGKVLVAAIVGDSQATDEAVREQERTEVSDAVCGLCPDGGPAKTSNKSSYVCSSSSGQADFGRRYLQLVEAFGVNGVAANICAGELAGPLELIADRVAIAVNRICLPRPVADDGITVELTDGETTRIVPAGSEMGTESFRLEAAPDCPGPVLIFNQRLPPEATIEVEYIAANGPLAR